MYNIDIVKSAMKLFNILTQQNIKGYKKCNMIINTFNIHINTLYNWIKKYKNNNYSSYNIKKNYKNTKITNEIISYIIEYVNVHKSISVKQIRIDIKNKFNINISISMIYFILHKNNLTYKQLTIKINPYSDELKNKLKSELKDKLNKVDHNNIVSIDEFAVYLNDNPTKGWAIKGKPCINETKNKTIKNKRYTVCMATTNKKILNYTIVEGGLKSLKFLNFIKKLNNSYSNLTYFIDNAAIHKTKIFNTYIKNNNLNVIYNIPYHSQYNPIEYVFSMLRKKVICGMNSSFNLLNEIIKNFKLNIEEHKLTNIFNRSLSLID